MIITPTATRPSAAGFNFRVPTLNITPFQDNEDNDSSEFAFLNFKSSFSMLFVPILL